MQIATKQFEIWSSERSYRFKEEAIHSHAPQAPGIYELVTFDKNQNGSVVFMGLTLDKPLFAVLYEHWRGERQPAVRDLLAKYPNLYFSFVAESSAQGDDDWKDLFWAMCQAEKPLLMDLSQVQPTGRYEAITFKDKSIL